MKIRFHSVLFACVASLIAACASAPIQHAYVAPTQQTVYTTTEEMTASPGAVIYVENHSSVHVTVYSATLRGCENVKGPCDSPRPLSLHIDPDSRAVLVRIQPEDPQKSYVYHLTFGWRADSTATAALGALATGGDSSAQRRLDAITQEAARRRAAVGEMDLDLSATDIAALADRAGRLRVLPDSIVIPVGRRASLDTVRVLLIGTQGETLGRIRAMQWRLLGSPAITLTKPDTVVAVAPGRTMLQVRLPDDVLAAKPALHAPLQVPIVVRP